MRSLGNKQSIGITFLDNSVYLVCGEFQGGGSYQIKKSTNKTFSSSFFEGEIKELITALTWVIKEIKKVDGYKGIPIHISLPDPVVFSHTFTFDSLPDKSVDDFIAWKLCNLFHLNKDEYSFQNTFLKTSTANSTLSLAVKSNVLNCLVREFSTERMPLASVNSQTCNNFDALKKYYSKDCGIHAFISNEVWSICLWDENKNLQTIKSRWISVNKPAEEIWSEIVMNTERVLRSYVNTHADMKINSMYVTGKGSEDFMNWAADDKSLKFQLMNELDSVKLLDACSLSDVLVAM